MPRKRSRRRGGALRQKIALRAGIPKDKSKPLIEAIKAAKLKVNAQYQDEQIRISGKSKDDLQKVTVAPDRVELRTAAAIHELPLVAAERTRITIDVLTRTRRQRVAFVSLGCAKNLVDSEVMIAKLGAAGWELVPEADDADAIVVNTCAFIDPAKAESTDVILEHAQRKRPGQQLIVAGCLSQRFGSELQSLIPEIDGVVGTGAYAGIVELLEDAQAGMRPVRLRF